MRIDLAEGSGKRKRQRKRSSQGRRRSRTRRYESAISLSDALTGYRGRQNLPSSTRSRGKGEDQPSQEQATGPAAAIRRSGKRMMLVRPVALLVLAGMLAIAVYISAADQFFVYSAQIVGNRNLGYDVLYEAAGIDALHILWVNPAEVAGRLSQVAGIKGASVSCSLPARVTITVQEREPLLRWYTMAQGREWWLDAEGVVLPFQGSAANTVSIVDASERTLEVGDRIEPEGLVQSVQQLAAALPGIQSFLYDSRRGLCYTQKAVGAEWPVYVGTTLDLERKIEAMQALNQYLDAHSLRPRYVDVTRPDYPVLGRPES